MATFFTLIPLHQKAYRLTNMQRCGFFLQYFVHLIISIGIAVASGYYYFNVEVNNQCKTQDNMDITQLFNHALIIVFAYHVIDTARNLLAILYIAFCLEFSVVERLYEILSINGCLGIAAFVYVHERFSDGGDFCSIKHNHLIPSENQLIQRGQLLYALVIIYWGIFGFQCLCCCSVLMYEQSGLEKVKLPLSSVELTSKKQDD